MSANFDPTILNKNGFYSPTRGSVTIGKIISEIRTFMDEDPTSFYNIVVGSDSQIKHDNGVKQCDFVTAIIVHRVGHGARYFWKKEKVMKAPVIRDKIYSETLRSLDIARDLTPILKDRLEDLNYNFEIHIDVGEVGKSREVIKEVVGMVSGSGFTAKTKPNSWGASHVADKHT